MKRINRNFAQLASAAPQTAPLAIVFACLTLGSGNLFALPPCNTAGGSLIKNSTGQIIGCAFSGWGPTEQSMCAIKNGIADPSEPVFSGPDPTKNCHICVASQYGAQIAADDFSGLSLVPVGGPSSPLSFHCLKCTPPPDGLTAWWTLDESVGNAVHDFTNQLPYDGVRYGATAVPGHDSTLGAYVANANHFNGANQYIEVPASNTQLNVGPGAANGSGDFSIDAWVKIDPNTDSSGVRVIAEKRTFSSPNHYKGYSFYLYKSSGASASASGYLGLQLADDGAAPGYSNYGAGSLVVPADGLWHFVAVSVARNPAAFNVQFTLDNKAVVNVSAPVRSGDLTNTSPLRIGMLTIGTGSVFNGSIDEVEFFNRAVPPGDFQSIYNAKCYGKCKN